MNKESIIKTVNFMLYYLLIVIMEKDFTICISINGLNGVRSLCEFNITQEFWKEADRKDPNSFPYDWKYWEVTYAKILLSVPYEGKVG